MTHQFKLNYNSDPLSLQLGLIPSPLLLLSQFPLIKLIVDDRHFDMVSIDVWVKRWRVKPNIEHLYLVYIIGYKPPCTFIKSIIFDSYVDRHIWKEINEDGN